MYDRIAKIASQSDSIVVLLPTKLHRLTQKMRLYSYKICLDHIMKLTLSIAYQQAKKSCLKKRKKPRKGMKRTSKQKRSPTHHKFTKGKGDRLTAQNTDPYVKTEEIYVLQCKKVLPPHTETRPETGTRLPGPPQRPLLLPIPDQPPTRPLHHGARFRLAAHQAGAHGRPHRAPLPLPRRREP